MSGADWSEYHEREQAAPALRRVPALLRRDQLPDDVRAMLDDPQRPRAMSRAEAYPMLGFILGRSEHSRRAEAVAFASEADRARHARWEHEQLRAIGYDPESFSGESFAPHDYAGLIYHTVLTLLLNEGSVSERGAKVEERDERRLDEAAVLAEKVPTDGHGLGYNDLAELWGMSRRSAETTVARLTDAGALRSESVASGRGGKPKKLFWRALDADLDGGDE